jgi:hypothetical protein
MNENKKYIQYKLDITKPNVTNFISQIVDLWCESFSASLNSPTEQST